MFQGVLTALVTPFLDGKVDFPSLEKLVDQQIQAGINGLLVCGTTGESCTLDENEKLQVLDFVCEKAKGRVPILFGSGSNNTKKTMDLNDKACKLAIDALLVVVPYYNKPPQEGLRTHFKTIADEAKKPILLYNVPGRTVTNLNPETIVELSKHPNIVGIKEAFSDINNFSKYKSLVPKDFSLLSGDDESCVSFCLFGGHGVISVCSHLAPIQMMDWMKRARNKDESVRNEFKQQHVWIKKLYTTSNPIPIKAALKARGVITSKEVRLPLVPLDDALEKDLLETLDEYRILI